MKTSRRSFLQRVISVVAGVAAAPHVPPQVVDPLRFLNQFDGIHQIEFFVEGVVARDVL